MNKRRSRSSGAWKGTSRQPCRVFRRQRSPGLRRPKVRYGSRLTHLTVSALRALRRRPAQEATPRVGHPLAVPSSGSMLDASPTPGVASCACASSAADLTPSAAVPESSCAWARTGPWTGPRGSRRPRRCADPLGRVRLRAQPRATPSLSVSAAALANKTRAAIAALGVTIPRVPSISHAWKLLRHGECTPG